MQNSNAGHTVQMLIFLSIQQPILCINLHYNGRGNKKKGKTIIIHILVMASGMIDHFFSCQQTTKWNYNDALSSN